MATPPPYTFLSMISFPSDHHHRCYTNMQQSLNNWLLLKKKISDNDIRLRRYFLCLHLWSSLSLLNIQDKPIGEDKVKSSEYLYRGWLLKIKDGLSKRNAFLTYPPNRLFLIRVTYRKIINVGRFHKVSFSPKVN